MSIPSSSVSDLRAVFEQKIAAEELSLSQSRKSPTKSSFYEAADTLISHEVDNTTDFKSKHHRSNATLSLYTSSKRGSLEGLDHSISEGEETTSGSSDAELDHLALQSRVVKLLQSKRCDAEVLFNQFERNSAFVTISNSSEEIAWKLNQLSTSNFKNLVKVFLSHLSPSASDQKIEEWAPIFDQEEVAKLFFGKIVSLHTHDLFAAKLLHLFKSMNDKLIPCDEVTSTLAPHVEMQARSEATSFHYNLNETNGKITLTAQGLLFPAGSLRNKFEITVSTILKTDIHQLPNWNAQIELEVRASQSNMNEIQDTIVGSLGDAQFKVKTLVL